MVKINMAATAAIVAATQIASSYRVKFTRSEFLELVKVAQPKLIYHVRRMPFFAYEGVVMYTFDCQDNDFTQRVLNAIEFSNQPWSE